MPLYYIKRFFHEQGPFSKEELEGFWLFPGTLVKSTEDEHWKTLDETAELVDLLPLAKKRFNVSLIVSSLCMSVIVFLILFFINRTHSPEIIEQNVNCKNEEVPYTAKPSVKRDTVVAEEEVETTDNEGSLITTKKPELLNVVKEPGKKIYLNQLENHKREVRNHFQDFINISHSSFMNDNIGGVIEVHVVLSNATIFNLDEVQVAAQYMDPKGALIDEIVLLFRDVKPMNEENKSAPSNSRCKFVRFIITSAKSKSLNFCYPSDKNSKKDKDPFYCR